MKEIVKKINLKGKEYYIMKKEKKRYEGDLKNNKDEGKGILYDENGNMKEILKMINLKGKEYYMMEMESKDRKVFLKVVKLKEKEYYIINNGNKWYEGEIKNNNIIRYYENGNK